MSPDVPILTVARGARPLPGSRRRSWLLLPVGILACGLAACRTTDGRDESASTAATSTNGLGATLDLTKDEGQGLYLKMLSVELDNGVKVPKEQLHSVKGVVACRHDAALAPCTVRIRLMSDDLSSTQPLPDDLAAKTWAFLSVSRPDLAAAPEGLADIACDYIGKKSPPYNVEDVHCAITLPRSRDEAVFDARLGEELGEALRGEAPYGTGMVTLSGTVSCQWLPGSPRTPCVVRAFAGGVLVDKLTEVSPGGAAQAARVMRQTLMDRAPVNGTPAAAPAEIAGALTCLIDNRTLESEGKRAYVCRAKL